MAASFLSRHLSLQRAELKVGVPDHSTAQTLGFKLTCVRWYGFGSIVQRPLPISAVPPSSQSRPVSIGPHTNKPPLNGNRSLRLGRSVENILANGLSLSRLHDVWKSARNLGLARVFYFTSRNYCPKKEVNAVMGVCHSQSVS